MSTRKNPPRTAKKKGASKKRDEKSWDESKKKPLKKSPKPPTQKRKTSSVKATKKPRTTSAKSEMKRSRPSLGKKHAPSKQTRKAPRADAGKTRRTKKAWPDVHGSSDVRKKQPSKKTKSPVQPRNKTPSRKSKSGADTRSRSKKTAKGKTRKLPAPRQAVAPKRQPKKSTSDTVKRLREQLREAELKATTLAEQLNDLNTSIDRAKRQASAAKGVEKRRANEKLKALQHLKRSEASKRGHVTRRMNRIDEQFKKRTLREREINKNRTNDRPEFRVKYDKGTAILGLDNAGQKWIVETIKDLRSRGVRVFRFNRQVPPTPSYPEGVSSTQWLNVTGWSDKRLNSFIGGMLVPGVDFLKTMHVTESDIPKLPREITSKLELPAELSSRVIKGRILDDEEDEDEDDFDAEEWDD